MAKNPSKKAVGKDEPMNGAMKFFLAGCVAELYLLILRRFYVNAGSDVARFVWYDHYLHGHGERRKEEFHSSTKGRKKVRDRAFQPAEAHQRAGSCPF